MSATQLPRRRRPLAWGLGQRLPHLVLLLLFPLQLSLGLPLQAQQTVDDFGRWESEARRCQLGVAPGGAVWPEAVATLGSGRTPGPGLTSGRVTTMGCETVRLDQQLPGLLSVRFFSRGQGPGPSKRLLMFAGILERDSPPMACRSGRCGWANPMRTRVSALAELGLDELGQGATSLPTTRLVQGSCSIQPKRIRCLARMEGEGSWWAEVDL